MQTSGQAEGTPLVPDITVVTAFLHPDPHSKNNPALGDEADPYTRWMEWSKLFRNMSNPVIAYLGSVQYMFYFESVRGSRAITDTNMTIVKLEDLETYKLRKEFESLMGSNGIEETSVNELLYDHSKYELLSHAAAHNPFHTTHMIWLDQAQYNAAFPNVHTYRVSIPENFDVTKIAYRTSKDFVSKTVDEVFKENETFLNGDFFLGAAETLKTWCQSYIGALKKYLSQGKLGTSETTLYAMMVDSDEQYVDQVSEFKTEDATFAEWYQKMSGVVKPYQDEGAATKKRRSIVNKKTDNEEEEEEEEDDEEENDNDKR